MRTQYMPADATLIRAGEIVPVKGTPLDFTRPDCNWWFLLRAVVALWLAGQTINIMTLGGLALAVGILVDEATVMIENIQTHLARGEKTALAVFRAGGEVIVPMLLSVVAVLAVFVPSFFMTGVSRSLFVPLSLAVGFAMLASYFLSSSLVPVLAVWILRPQHAAEKSHRRFERLRERYAHLAEK